MTDIHHIIVGAYVPLWALATMFPHAPNGMVVYSEEFGEVVRTPDGWQPVVSTGVNNT